MGLSLKPGSVGSVLQALVGTTPTLAGLNFSGTGTMTWVASGRNLKDDGTALITNNTLASSIGSGNNAFQAVVGARYYGGSATGYLYFDGSGNLTTGGGAQLLGNVTIGTGASTCSIAGSGSIAFRGGSTNISIGTPGTETININPTTGAVSTTAGNWSLGGPRFDARSAAFTNFTLGTAGNAYLSLDMAGFGAGIMSLSRVCGSSTTAMAEVVGALNINTTAVGNVGASGPDDLITYPMPANTIAANTQGVRITAWGTTANNANAKTVRLMFGGTALVTKQLTASVAGTWKLMATVMRTGASAQKFYAEAMNDQGTTVSGTDGATVQRIAAATTSAETDTATITIKCQSTVSTADNDIVNQGLITEWL